MVLERRRRGVQAANNQQGWRRGVASVLFVAVCIAGAVLLPFLSIAVVSLSAQVAAPPLREWLVSFAWPIANDFYAVAAIAMTSAIGLGVVTANGRGMDALTTPQRWAVASIAIAIAVSMLSTTSAQVLLAVFADGSVFRAAVACLLCWATVSHFWFIVGQLTLAYQLRTARDSFAARTMRAGLSEELDADRSTRGYWLAEAAVWGTPVVLAVIAGCGLAWGGREGQIAWGAVSVFVPLFATLGVLPVVAWRVTADRTLPAVAHVGAKAVSVVIDLVLVWALVDTFAASGAPWIYSAFTVSYAVLVALPFWLPREWRILPLLSMVEHASTARSLDRTEQELRRVERLAARRPVPTARMWE